nr:hypothetical protein [Candidatus Freyarchaeota archaeon]
MVKFNPVYNAIILGILLSAAEKIGINPVLIGRQTSRLLAPLLDSLFKRFIGKTLSLNNGNLLEDIKKIVKTGEISDPEKLELTFSGNCVTLKLADCMYLDMANYGKTLGHDCCPMCIAGVFMTGVLSSLDTGEVLNFKVENKENNCIVKFAILEK